MTVAASEKARVLVDLFKANPMDAKMGAAFDALIAEYEASLVRLYLVRLYAGRGAWAFHGDPEAALAAYRRAAQLDPDNSELREQMEELEKRIMNGKGAQ